MKLKLTTVLMLFVSASVTAEEATGKVTELWINQKVWVRLDTMTSPSNLSCNTTRRFVADGETDKGKNIYAALLAAKASGEVVTIVGDNKCDIHHDSEGMKLLRQSCELFGYCFEL